MGKNPERSSIENGKNKPSLLDRAKKIGGKIRDGIYNVMGQDYVPGFGYTFMKKGKIGIEGLTKAKYDDFMLCGKYYVWAEFGDVWRLIDKEGREQNIHKDDGKEEVFEVDDVKISGINLGDKLFYQPIPEGRLFQAGSKKGVVADNGTVIMGDYAEMYLSDDIYNQGYAHSIAVGKEILPNGEEKLRYIFLEDGSISEHVPFNSEDDE